MTSTQPANAPSRNTLTFAAAVYLLFVVYGSLVPFNYYPRTADAAWRAFLAIPYLSLEVESRADWIANILLYIPLAYLLSAAFAAGARSAVGRVILVVPVFVVCAAIAFGVEFAQVFFPPRTVSLNDIVAEFIGSGLGIAIWLFRGDALVRLWLEMKRGGMPAIRAATVIYVLAYLALSLFPYDFLVSAQEFSAKLAVGNSYGLLVASEACGRPSICAGKLVAETIAVVPLGVLLGMALGKSAQSAYTVAVLCGLALGLTIEALQLIIASGISQGMSLVTRAAGMAVGVALHRHVRLRWVSDLQPYATSLVVMMVPAYLLALMWVNGWFTASWAGIAHARKSFDAVFWLPFYYHYFTTETAALRSALAYVAMYLPVGFGYWLWSLRPGRTRAGGSALVPALIAAPLALAMEMGKLFVPGKHPDPTDVLIAMIAAPAAYLLARQLQEWALQGAAAPRSRSAPAAASSRVAGREAAASSRVAGRESVAGQSVSRVLMAILLLCGAGIAVLKYPLGGAWLAMALGLYGALIWRYPGACLPAVLALLPLLNFSPWSGWVLLNEFDLLIAVTLAVRLLRPPPDIVKSSLTGGARWMIGLVALSFFISAVAGVLPLSPLDQNALFTYYSGYDGLRHLKGFAWALMLLPLLIEEAQHPQRMAQRIVDGMLVGLGGVVAVTLYERAVFSALMDFAGEYRVQGTFPELHTGGGDIHAYLATAMPFIVAWILLRLTAFRVACGVVLFGLASYALAVTFARGGYIGYWGAMGVLVVAGAVYWLRQRSREPGRLALGALLVLVGVSITLAIVAGPFMQSRLKTLQTESATRTQHWARAVEMMDANVVTTLFGMGLGSFPRTFLVKDRGAASATYSYVREGDNGFVRLGSGKALYLDQRVTVADGKSYTLALDLRSTDPKGGVHVPLCEKSLQYSFRCKETGFRVKAPGSWEHNVVTFNSEQIGSGPWFLRRPAVLSLSNSTPGGVIDVDNVRLLDETGRDLIANGDFSQGGARWFFSADDHLPWHIFNLWVQILFEQGWFGVVVLAAIVALALAQLAARVWKGEWLSAILLTALCGFLLTGLTESLFDGPRVTTLFFLLLFVSLLRPHWRGSP